MEIYAPYKIKINAYHSMRLYTEILFNLIMGMYSMHNRVIIVCITNIISCFHRICTVKHKGTFYNIKDALKKGLVSVQVAHALESPSGLKDCESHDISLKAAISKQLINFATGEIKCPTTNKCYKMAEAIAVGLIRPEVAAKLMSITSPLLESNDVSRTISSRLIISDSLSFLV